MVFPIGKRALHPCKKVFSVSKSALSHWKNGEGQMVLIQIEIKKGCLKYQTAFFIMKKNYLIILTLRSTNLAKASPFSILFANRAKSINCFTN